MAEDRKTVSLRLRPATLVAVDQMAASTGKKRHDWLVDAVERGLDDGLVVDDAGNVEVQTRRDIGALVCAHPMGEALAALAYSLARSLDNGAGMATAAVSRELRATLIELAKYEGGSVDDDDAPDLSASALGDPEDPDETDTW